MIDQAELLLVKIAATKAYEKCYSFDDLRTKMYKHSRDKKFIKLPCSSNEICQNTTRMWLESPYGDVRELLHVEDYG